MDRSIVTGHGNETRMILMEYLQEPPGNFSPTTIERQAGKVQRLRNLGVCHFPGITLTPAQLHTYAQGMRKRRPSRFLKLKEPRRTLE
jgi:hypothetical protein